MIYGKFYYEKKHKIGKFTAFLSLFLQKMSIFALRKAINQLFI